MRAFLRLSWEVMACCRAEVPITVERRTGGWQGDDNSVSAGYMANPGWPKVRCTGVMSRKTHMASVLGLVAVMAGGCACRNLPTCPPQRSMVVTLAELTGQSVSLAPGTYQLLGEPGTVGRFPCTIGFAQVTHRDEANPTSDSGLAVRPFDKDKMVYWIELLDNLYLVSEVYELDGKGAPQAPVSVVDVHQLAGRSGADLCLVMSAGVSGSEPGCQVVGAVYETATGRPLVYARSGIYPEADPDPMTDEIIDEMEKAQKARQREEGCIRRSDEDPEKAAKRMPPYDGMRLAEAHFRSLIRQAVWEMARKDELPDETSPSPWSDWRRKQRLLLWPSD